MKTNQMWKMLMSFLKVGTIGFGGGSALIPVIEKEVVETSKLVDQKEYDKDVIVASITPGALPVEIAAGVGRKAFGVPGMILSAIMMALPGAFLTVLLISIFSKSEGGVVKQIGYGAIGITMFIILLITTHIQKVVGELGKKKRGARAWGMILMIFFLTCGKEIRSLFGLGGTPIFDISTVSILMITFFAIFYTEGKFKTYKTVVASVICALYLLCIGKAQLIANDVMLYGLQIVMVLLAVRGVARSVAGKEAKRNVEASFSKLLKEEGAWILFGILLSLPAFFVTSQAGSYVGNGLFSSIISFGGGDAYLSVADGIFVENGMISSDNFYSQLVPVANSLPGSILCKVLTGVGYYIGYSVNESLLEGYLVALAGFAVSIMASCGVFALVLYIYERFENLSIFQTLKRWIGPIVCGLLLSVSVSMIGENVSIVTNEGGTVLLAGGLCAAAYAMNVFLYYKQKYHNLVLIVASGALSLLVCNLCI